MILTRKVQKIVEHVFPDGFVRPILVLNKPFEVKHEECRTIVLSGVRALYEQKIGRGSVIKFEVEDTDVNVLRSYGGETIKRKHLELCSFCHHQVVFDTLHEMHKCTNPFCHGKSRAPVLRLTEQALKAFEGEGPSSLKRVGLAVRLFEGKLDRYPTRDGSVILRDIHTFLMVFESLREKNTATRTTHWQTVCGSAPASLEVHKIEVCIQEYLRSGKIFKDPKELWSILNIPVVKHRHFEALPTEIEEDFYFQVKDFLLPEKYKVVLRKNSDFIVRTSQALKAFVQK